MQFRAVDAAGNASDWTPSAFVSLDRTAPTAPTITGGTGPGTWATTTPVSVSSRMDSTDSISGVASYQYRESSDGQTWQHVNPANGDNVSREGVTWVEFSAVDQAGNISGWSAPRIVQLDTSAPDVPTMRGVTGAGWAKRSVTVQFDQPSDNGGSGFAYFEYRVSTDAGMEHAGQSSVQVTSEGFSWVQVRAFDTAGNVSAWSPHGFVQIDTTAPTVPTITGGTDGWARSAPVGVSSLMDSTDSGGSGVASYQYRESYDGGVTWQPTVQLANGDSVDRDGVTWVEFSAVDTVGNASDWSDPQIVQIYRLAAPVVTGGHGSAPDSSDSSSVVWHWDPVVDPLNPGYEMQYQIEISFYGSDWIDYGSLPTTALGTAPGQHCYVQKMRVRAVGSIGLMSDWSDVTEDSIENFAC